MAMQFSLEFAYQNRRAMSHGVKKAFHSHLDFQIIDEINIRHNCATPYILADGPEVTRHRKKSATAASINTIGIIPGTQESSSFIVKGKGSPTYSSPAPTVQGGDAPAPWPKRN